MKKASEYRQLAEDCRVMARKARAEERAPLLAMAAAWDGLANERDRTEGKR